MLKKILFFAVLAYIALRIYKLCLFMGFHVTVFNHHPGPCRHLPDIEHGAEDMELLPGDKVLMTTGLRFWDSGNPNYADVKSGVMMFNFNAPDKGVVPVTIKDFKGLDDCDFHGLSIYVDKKTGAIGVYIVNHLPGFKYSVVEIFTYNEKENVLYHKDTVGYADPNFGTLNDVLVVGPRQFYVTNTLYSHSKLELFAQLKWAPITFWDGKKSHVAAEERFIGGNGIAQSNDGKYVFVASSFDRELRIYTRNADNTLDLLEKVPTYINPDNIIVDPDTGDLWIGGHPSTYMTFEYMDNPAVGISASMVLRLGFKDGSITDINEVFSDDGKFFSGSSVAIYRKNQLLVGSVKSKAILCDVKYL